jgi:YD repeat-containing protein
LWRRFIKFLSIDSSCTNYVYDPQDRLVAVTGARTVGLRYDPHRWLHAVSDPAGALSQAYGAVCTAAWGLRQHTQ